MSHTLRKPETRKNTSKFIFLLRIFTTYLVSLFRVHEKVFRSKLPVAAKVLSILASQFFPTLYLRQRALIPVSVISCLEHRVTTATLPPGTKPLQVARALVVSGGSPKRMQSSTPHALRKRFFKIPKAHSTSFRTLAWCSDPSTRPFCHCWPAGLWRCTIW